MNRLPAVVALLALAGYAGHASAATYCVADATQLRNAINDVSNLVGTVGNEIRIQSGTYNVAAGASGDFALSLELASAPLTITGGWNAGCSQRNLIADATILSGNNTVRVMDIYVLAGFAASLVVDGVSFRNGQSANGNIASCLRIETDINNSGFPAEIAIDRSSFRNCRATGSATGPALSVLARNSFIRIRSSVFTDNAGQVGTVSLGNQTGTIYFTGNTVAYNDDIGAAGGPAGVQVSGAGGAWVVGNILWGNGGAGSNDLFVNTNVPVFSSHNVFGVLGGDLGDLNQTGNLSGNPGFNSPTDLRLRADSIARNSGPGSAPGEFTDRDVFGGQRVRGGRVDRGAHEFEDVFANSFE